MVAALLALTVTACSTELPESRGVSGTVVVDGSSTLTPLVAAGVEELVTQVEPGLDVELATSGTTTGLARLCDGTADVAMASREMTDDEVGVCTAAGIDAVAVPVGLDAISLVVPDRNDYVSCLTTAEAASLLAGAGEAAPLIWSDVRPEWPGTTLALFAPGPASGTADVVADRLLDGSVLRSDVATSEDDDAIVQGVASSPGGLGVVPLTYALAAADQVRAVGLDDGEGCVVPTAETAADGSYPLSRELFVYVSRDEYADRASVAALVDYLVARATPLAEQVGGVPGGRQQQSAAEEAIRLLGGAEAG